MNHLRTPLQTPRGPRSAGVAALLTGVLSGLALLTGCAVGPNYTRPAVATPPEYRFAADAVTTNSYAELPWWEVFQDPPLQELIRAALTNNFDLRRAIARVEQAQNLAVSARAPLFPQVGYGGGVGRGKNALYNSPSDTLGAIENSGYIAVNATWEIDLWGRIRRQSEAAQAEYLAADAVRRGVMVSLIGDVATGYFQLLQFDRELAIQRAATNAFAGTYRIFNDRRQNGVASKLESDRAAAAFASAAAVIPQLKLQVATTENYVSILAGRPPGPVPRSGLTELPPLATAVPAGLPSALLQRRPDIQATEDLLIAANAKVGASLANFFPQIGLTTFFGKVSPELSALSSGSASAWNVGATLAGPLFQGGALRAQYRAAKAQFEETKASYEQSVLNALREVSDALIARENFGEVRAFNAQAVAALTTSVQLATERYLAGKSSYIEVLQAQQELYPTQRAEAQAQIDERLALVQLYKALGGGWQTPPVDPPTGESPAASPTAPR